MNEEEKKAIGILKSKKTEFSYRNIDVRNSVEILLKLVEKQQKEIEQFYKEININTEIHKRDIKIKDLEETIQCLHEADKGYIHKDKIREKIKYYQEMGKDVHGHWYYENEIELLKELLEE